jgi:hypothetical protein
VEEGGEEEEVERVRSEVFTPLFVGVETFLIKEVE